MTQKAQNPFIEFVTRYRFNAVLFVKEVLGMDGHDADHTIDAWQLEVLEAVSKGERRISIRSGHGVGKTTVLAWIVVWQLCTRFPQKTVCTAPTGKQLFDALYSEVVSWIKRLPKHLVPLFEIKSEEINLKAAPEDSFVSFRTSRLETPEALAGVHSQGWVLLIPDEASGIPEPVFEAASGSMSGHNACTILAGNPVRTSGLFFDTHHKLRDMWHTIHVSCVGHPRISPDFVDDMRRRYGGEDTNAFRVRVLGEFPKSDNDAVVPFELMEASLKRDVKAAPVRPVWGVDVATTGGDKAALARRQGNVLLEPVTTFKDLETMQLAGRIKNLWDETPTLKRPEEILVDSIGIGAGVAERLRELGLPARGINVSESPALTERYANLKAELWWTAREWFEARDCSLANDETLGEELVAVKFLPPTSSGKIRIEPKDMTRKMLGRSPDLADAFVLTFAASATAALYGERNATRWNEPLKREIRGIV